MKISAKLISLAFFLAASSLSSITLFASNGLYSVGFSSDFSSCTASLRVEGYNREPDNWGTLGFASAASLMLLANITLATTNTHSAKAL